MSNWYLVHTKIRQEQVAKDNLERQGFPCFLPQMQSERLRRGALQIAQEPLFPRYLFIRLGTGLEAQSWAPIRHTLGVSRLVSFGHTPAKVSDELVAEIRAQVDKEQVQFRHFTPGEPLLVSEGPFKGLEALYYTPDAEGRVMVLLNMMSKQVKLSVAPASLAKLS